MMNKLQNTLPIIVGNWKSHKTIPEARAWVQEWNELANQSVLSKLEVVVAPPLVALDATGTALRAAPRLSSVQLAAQDVSSYPVGSYTGGSPAKILASLGIHYTLAGHSERRNYFHETSRDVAAKALYSIEAGITPIVCVDEPYFAEQLAQLDTALLEKIIWAYE
jgi:triosephosphate isomerase